MKEIENINILVKGGLFTEEDGKNALLVLFSSPECNNITFTNKELFKIYVDVKCRLNFAPEENEDFEVKLAKNIIEKINNCVC